MQLAPWVLTRPIPPLRLISHKLLRLALPFALAVILMLPWLCPNRSTALRSSCNWSCMA